MKKRIYLMLILLIICCSLIVICLKIKGLSETKKYTQETVNKVYDSSESSIVMDINTKRVLYENKINKRMLPASTTKILTCITALELYNLDDVVIVTHDMVSVEGSSIYLEVGDAISVNDLLYGLMLCSGNDAAMALAYHYSGNLKDFIYKMNELAKEIGMKDSTFENPHGLDESTKNYTTVYDMALLMSYAMKNNIFRKITKTVTYNPKIYSNRQLYFYNKHKLIRNDETVTGGKTGYTKLAHRTLVTSFNDDDFEIVVVTFNCSDDWNVHSSLAKYVFDKYSLKRIVSKIELLVISKGNYYIDTSLLYYPKLSKEEVNYKIFEGNNCLVINYYINDKLSGYVEFKGIANE